MDECFAWMRQSPGPKTTKQARAIQRLTAEIQLRKEDVTHSRLAVEIASDAVKSAYRTYGKSSTQVTLAATRLARERVRETACGQVLKQLEDAHHMMTLKEMTTSALGTLKMTGVGGQNLDGLLDVTDNEMAMVDEARQQIDEIAKCFSTDTHCQDVDDVLASLGLETSLDDGGATAVSELPPSTKRPTDRLPEPEPQSMSVLSPQIDRPQTRLPGGDQTKLQPKSPSLLPARI